MYLNSEEHRPSYDDVVTPKKATYNLSNPSTDFKSTIRFPTKLPQIGLRPEDDLLIVNTHSEGKPHRGELSKIHKMRAQFNEENLLPPLISATKQCKSPDQQKA